MIPPAPETIPWNGLDWGLSADLENLISLKIFKNRMFRELPLSIMT
jgi:hypothetical protein